MRTLDAAIEDLKALSPLDLTNAADYIHRLRGLSELDHWDILDHTSGSLEPSDADAMELVIANACERIDDGA